MMKYQGYFGQNSDPYTKMQFLKEHGWILSGLSNHIKLYRMAMSATLLGKLFENISADMRITL
jgi:hypothetical protein